MFASVEAHSPTPVVSMKSPSPREPRALWNASIHSDGLRFTSANPTTTHNCSKRCGCQCFSAISMPPRLVCFRRPLSRGKVRTSGRALRVPANRALCFEGDCRWGTHATLSPPAIVRTVCAFLLRAMFAVVVPSCCSTQRRRSPHAGRRAGWHARIRGARGDPRSICAESMSFYAQGFLKGNR